MITSPVTVDNSVTLLSAGHLLFLRLVVTTVIPLLVIAVFIVGGLPVSSVEPVFFLFFALFTNGLGYFLGRAEEQRASWRIRGALLGDVCLLTLFLVFYGGPANPFSVLYLVHIAVAAMMLSAVWIWSITALCWFGFGVSFFIHRPLPTLAAHHHGDPFSLHLYGMWGAFVVTSSLIAYFVSKLSLALAEKHRIVQALQIDASHQQRLAALTTLAAGAAHELNTPLGTILVAVEGILDREDRSDELELSEGSEIGEIFTDAALIKREVLRCADIIRRMSGGLGSDVQVEAEVFEWQEVIDTVTQTFGIGTVVFGGDVSGKTSLCAPKRELISSIGALIKNGIEAQNELGSSLKVSCNRSTGSNIVTVRVEDSGSGISPEDLDHVGEPFFTTKEPGKGLGLGLFLVRLFAARQGGTLSVQSHSGKGTTATLVLPILSEKET